VISFHGKEFSLSPQKPQGKGEIWEDKRINESGKRRRTVTDAGRGSVKKKATKWQNISSKES
jgi:hypothetical protein